MGGVGTISASRLLSETECKLSSCVKEALACLFGVEKFATYLKSSEFDLYTENRVLGLLFNHCYQFGKIGHCVYCILKFRFKIHHISGKENMVADALSRIFDSEEFHVQPTGTDNNILLFAPPRQEHSDLKIGQSENPFCIWGMQDVTNGVHVHYGMHNAFVVYTGVQGKACKSVVSACFHLIVLKYFHASLYGGHLGNSTTLQKIAGNFYWSSMKQDVTACVQSCSECQQCKPPRNTKLVLHYIDSPSFGKQLTWTFMGRCLAPRRSITVI